MGKKIIILVFGILLLWTIPVWAEFPVHLGGFVLGEDISKYQGLVQMTTCREMARTPYLAEGEIMPLQGFKSGLITYGLCHRPNKILRIKLKFIDSSKNFFSLLLDRYTDRFGAPGEYKGDPFQTLVAWKWSFTNPQKERISLILQHNKMIEDEKKGTVVKMTLTSQLDNEKICYQKTHPEPESPVQFSQPKLSKEQMWKHFIPY
ncbi:hypothetical protein [Desulfospira joergensenii]|uniref:hypothetical protein n=1 Tax=Desulfospira joergensenii TaxID=53329 RepID=UPI0003B5A0B7|nr:hypothetical protein [Desulfospira joergensenii]